ncbi:hypothetical protein [Azospirillum soli]|uniref:hypothetical protein n=1 Tax=Azospirillum soli TaxID=1304799 RepID=UPI0031B86FAA
MTELIAEQIETDEQLHCLRQLGIRCGQGYLFGKPAADLPSAECPAAGRPMWRTGKRETWE